MGRRILTGALLIIISVSLVIHSKWAMALLIFPVGIIGSIEFYNLAKNKGIKPSAPSGVLGVIVLYTAALVFSSESLMTVLLTGLILLTMFVFVFRKDNHVSSFLDAGVTMLGFIYIGWLFSMIFCIRNYQGIITAYGFEISQGAAMVLLLVFTTCFTDIGSFFFGKLFGKTKLCAHISPNKTVEGSIGGILTGIAVSLLTGWILSLGIMDSLWFGLIISIVAQMGDLWESVLKRDVEVKDSGEAFPGHGGVLDRFDSLFLTTPVAYFLFKYLIGF